MAVAGPLPALVVAMLLAGATITPQVTAHSLGVEATAPTGTATEAFGWVVTAATLGLSSGQSTAGMVVEAFGPHAAFAGRWSGGRRSSRALLWLSPGRHCYARR